MAEKMSESNESLVKIFRDVWTELRRNRGEKVDNRSATSASTITVDDATKKISCLEFWVQLTEKKTKWTRAPILRNSLKSERKVWETFKVVLEYPTKEEASFYAHGMYYIPKPSTEYLQNLNLEFDQWFVAQEFPPKSKSLKILRCLRPDPSSTNDDDIKMELIQAVEWESPGEDIGQRYVLDLSRSASKGKKKLKKRKTIGLVNNNLQNLNSPILVDNSQDISVPTDIDLSRSASKGKKKLKKGKTIGLMNNNLQNINSPILVDHSQDISVPTDIDNLQKISIESQQTNFINTIFQNEYAEDMKCQWKMANLGRRRFINKEVRAVDRNNPYLRGREFGLQKYSMKSETSSHQLDPAPAHLPVTYLNPTRPYPAHQAIPYVPYQLVPRDDQHQNPSPGPSAPPKYTKKSYMELLPKCKTEKDTPFQQSLPPFETAQNQWCPQQVPLGEGSTVLRFFPEENVTTAHDSRLFKVPVVARNLFEKKANAHQVDLKLYK